MRRVCLFLVPACTALIGLGACIESATLDNGATTGTGGTGECGSDELACGAECVRSEIDPANCGDCGIACPADFVCQAGHCAEGCVAGTVECNGGCVDTEGDAQHCGDCNQPCAPSEVCVGGMCSLECPEGKEKCGNECVDLDTDADHCGNCMTDCDPDQKCEAKECVDACGEGTTYCNGDCVNTDVDANNCGACGNVCASGKCSTSLVADLYTQTSSWSYNGDATTDFANQSALLTDAQPGQLGTIFYKFPIEIDEFVLSFQFRIGGGNGADGMAFAMQSDGGTAVGIGGGGLGVTGLTGYGVELDTFDNPGSCDDPGFNHLGIDLLDECNMLGMPTSIFSNPNVPFNIDDNQWHIVHLSLEPGGMKVWLDNMPYITTPVALPDFTPGTPYYLGFGASGGSQSNKHEVRALAMSVPTVRCM
jgi:hypothetical protein